MAGRGSAIAASLLAAALTLPAALGGQEAAPPASGGELLARVRATYRAVGGYHDRGRLTTATGELTFETMVAGAGFRLTVDGADGRHLLWRDADGIFLRLPDGTVIALPSLAAGLAPSLGADGRALLVPAGLLAGSDPLAEPTAVALDGEADCGARRCHLLTLSSGDGAFVTLWVDADTSLVRRVEREDALAGAAERPAVATIEVLASGGEAAATLDLTAEPPARTATLEGAPPAASPPVVFGEVIDVQLATLVARVTDPFGQAIPDLAAEQFRVTLDGREVPVVALDWVTVDASGEAPDELDYWVVPGGEIPGLAPLARPDVPIVYFFQCDLDRTRIKGHLRLRPLLDDLVTRFAGHPQAVVAFDSHLKLWQDFTDEPEALRAAMWDAMRFGGAPPVRRYSERRGDLRGGGGLRLAAHWDQRAAFDVATPEAAIGLLGETLQELPPGEKLVVYVGWGMGVRDPGWGVQNTADFAPAVAALHAAEVTVHVLDVTYADLHTLSVGLQRVAAATGGTYAGTHRFAARAVDHLVTNVGGRYLLTVDVSAAPGGTLAVEVRDRPATVFAELLRNAG